MGGGPSHFSTTYRNEQGKEVPVPSGYIGVLEPPSGSRVEPVVVLLPNRVWTTTTAQALTPEETGFVLTCLACGGIEISKEEQKQESYSGEAFVSVVLVCGTCKHSTVLLEKVQIQTGLGIQPWQAKE